MSHFLSNFRQKLGSRKYYGWQWIDENKRKITMREYATKRAYKFRRFMRNAVFIFGDFLVCLVFVVLSVYLDSLIVLANQFSDYESVSLSIPNDFLYLFQFHIIGQIV